MEQNEQIIDQGTIQQESMQIKQRIPNSSGILTLGILSIVFAGGIGIILGIIALGLSGGAYRIYRSNPEKFTEGSFKNLNAGKVCAIIGVSLAGLLILIFVGAGILANL